MKTVEEHNAEALARYEDRRRDLRDGVPLGVACPDCGAELFNPSPAMVFASNPPQVRAACKAAGCDYKGSIIE